MQPWIEEASALMNLSVLAMLCRPHLVVSSVRLFLLTCQLRGVSLSVAI
jgi:hypothetical protein